MSTSKQATVEDASPSPPPLPTEQPPLPTGQPPLPTGPVPGAVDEPITSLGDGVSDDDDDDDDDENDEQEEWDPSEERLPGQERKKGEGKGKGKEPGAGGEGGGEAKAHPWQAVWSAEKNAWYFWNTSTGEVTWTNPLEPSSSSAAGAAAPPLPSGPPPTVSAGLSEPTYGGGGAGEMDPALAHLLPPEMRAGGTSSDGSQRALFNARTGRFTGGDYKYTVDHLDEYNRAKRMNSHYFDVDAWEREKQEEAAKRKWEEETGTGSSKKQITKKDMDRFRKKKAEKRARSQAWLRD